MPIAASSQSASQWFTGQSIPLHPFSNCYSTFRPMGKDDLRLIHLFPPGKNDEIQCKMFRTRVSTSPTYEALSYAWGSPRKRRLIKVNGISVRVGENLWHALRALRPLPGHSARCLWVDALCINQENRVETFREVQKIVPIYASATRVICWLGSDASEQAGAAVKLIRAVKTSFGNRDFSNARQLEKFVNFLYERQLVHAGFDTAYLFSVCPYWQRVWIRQELISATDIKIQCGRYTIPWEDAAQTCAALDKLNELYGTRVGLGGTIFYYKHFRWIYASRSLFPSITGPEWFLEQLVACRSAAATDPKDKVYGLCGLFLSRLDEDSQRLMPNYCFSLMDVYLQAFQYCVFDCTGKPRSDHCLDILCSSRLRSHGRPRFPSWLPDWSQDVTSTPISHKLRPGISASLGRKAELFIHPNGKLLRCKGLRLGAIDRIGRCFRVPSGGTDFLRHRLKVFCSWCDMANEILDPGEDWSRLISILWLDTDICDGDHDSIDNMNRDVQKILDYNRHRDPEGDFEDTPSAFHKITGFPWLNHRRLAVSDRSKLVLVPEEAREGDRIWVIYGCSVPILLRRFDRGTFQVIGDCYVEGYMNGEAIKAHNQGGLGSSQLTLR